MSIYYFDNTGQRRQCPTGTKVRILKVEEGDFFYRKERSVHLIGKTGTVTSGSYIKMDEPIPEFNNFGDYDYQTYKICFAYVLVVRKAEYDPDDNY